MAEPPSRPKRRHNRKTPTNRISWWRKAGEAITVFARIVAALAVLYGTVSSCWPVS